jgi:drug/metabolite transporter (DMT)-like permease
LSLIFNRHFALLHLIVFIWGFSPVLGRYIVVDAWQLVWFRIIITITAMFIYIRVKRHDLKITGRQFRNLSITGLVVATHWVCFYGAIKVSNISVTMVAFSTGTLFSSMLEPFFFKRSLRVYEFIIGLIIIAAVGLIFSIHFEYWQGIVLGIAAAFTGSLFGVFNGIMARTIRPSIISIYEMLAAFTGLSVFLLCRGDFTSRFFVLDQQSVIGILILSLACTVFPFITSVSLTRHISPYTIVLTVNLETVYGIIWAALLYSENREMKPTFYVGVVIIFLAIFLNSYLRKMREQKTLRIPDLENN